MSGKRMMGLPVTGMMTTAVVSVATLLAVFGSVTPLGAVTAAVLVSVPLADWATVPRIVKVARPLAGKITVVLMTLPEPLVVAQLPKVVAQTHVTVMMLAGITLATDALITVPGPLLVIMTV